jgi:hypothetical protein
LRAFSCDPRPVLVEEIFDLHRSHLLIDHRHMQGINPSERGLAGGEVEKTSLPGSTTRRGR